MKRATVLICLAFVVVLLSPSVASATVSFAPETALVAGAHPRGLAAGDVNGDGNRDLVVANFDAATILVYLGDGAGGFGAGTSYAVGTNPCNVVIADWSCDGYDDVAVVNSGSGTVTVFHGAASGALAVWTSLNVGGHPESASATDYNLDGYIDLAVCDASLLVKRHTPVYLGSTLAASTDPTSNVMGSWSFTAANLHTTGNYPSFIACDPSNLKVVYTRAGTSVESNGPPVGVGVYGAHALATGSFNQDTFGDIVAGHGTQVDLWKGHLDMCYSNPGFPDGAGVVLTGPYTFNTGSSSARGIAVGDFNCDTNSDVVTANNGSDNLSLLLGNGAAQLGVATLLSLPAGSQPQQVVVADFNNDGRKDLAVTDWGTNAVSVLLNTSAPSGTMAIDGDDTYALSTDVTVGSSVSDATEMRFSVDGGSAWTAWEPYATYRYHLALNPVDGTQTVYAQYRNCAGTVHGTLPGDPVLDTIILDTATPSGAMAIDDGADYAKTTAVTLDSAAVLNAFEMRFRKPDDAWPDWEVYQPLRFWALPDGDGPKTVEAEYRDWLGYTYATSDDITLDTTAPSTEARSQEGGIPLDSSQWWPSPFMAELNGRDFGSGMASVRYRIDGDGPTVESGSGSELAAFAFFMGEGDYDLEYWSVDAAGNEELPHNHVTVRIDDSAPSVHVDYLDGVHGSGGWFISPVRVHLIGDDAPSGLASLWWSTPSPGPWHTYSPGSPPEVEWQGTRQFYGRALDNAGLEAIDSQSIAIDTHDPHTLYSVDRTPSAWGWYNHAVNATLEATDDGSGVDALHVRVDAPSPSATWTPYPHPVDPLNVPLLTEGTHTIEYKAQDVAGREEEAQSREVRIDMTPPETTTDRTDSFFDAWHDGAVTVGLSAADPEGGGGAGGVSGVAETSGRVDGAGWAAEEEVAVAAPSDGSNDGAHVVQYRALDRADNYEAAHTRSVKIDTTAPRTTDDAPAGAHEKDVAVTLTATDDPPAGREGQLTSGVDRTEYRLDGGDWTSGSEVQVPAPPDGSNDGVHEIEYRSSDNAGHVETAHACSVLIDTTTLDAAPWRAQISGIGDTLRGVSVVYEEEAYAVGFNGRVLYTTDGGATWVPRSTGMTQSFFDVAVNDGPLEDCDAAGTWVVGARGVLLRSTDKGASWQSRSFTTANLNAAACVGQDCVWVAGAGGLLARSTNGGASWTPAPTGTSETIFDISFFNEERGWACGYAGTILATTDGGATWAREVSGTTQTLRSISFFDGQTGCAVGTAGTVLRTTDGGVTWTSVPVTGSALFGVHACGGGAGSGADGWACGAGGLVLRTSDAGAHWVQEPSGTTDTLYAVGFTDDPVGWAVGATGRVLYRDACAPLTTAFVPSGWQTVPVTVALDATDVGMGVGRTRFSLDGGLWRDGSSVYLPAPGDGSNDGVHTIDYRSTDAAGNTEALRSCDVRIDTQLPSAFDNSDGVWHRNYDLQLSGDDVTSGIDHFEYSLDGGAWCWGDSLILRTWRRGANSGLHTIDYRSVDRAGNVSPGGHCTVGLDRIAPQTTDDAPAGPQTSDVTVTLTATDDLSGPGETFYSLDGDSWQTGTTVLVPAPLDGSKNGIHWIAYYSVDALGNAENWRFCAVEIAVP